jgi:hypothetical protein
MRRGRVIANDANDANDASNDIKYGWASTRRL